MSASAGLPRLLSRVRTRLLAAFLVMFAAAAFLAAAGWSESRRMQRELVDVQLDLLPHVFNALALSELASQLASAVSNFDGSTSLSELESRQRETDTMLMKIRQDAKALSSSTPQLQSAIDRLQSGVQRNLPTLTQCLRQRFAFQSHLAEGLVRLDVLRRSLRLTHRDARIAALWSTLVLGTAVNDGTTMGRVEGDAEALRVAIRKEGGNEALADPLVRELLALSGGPSSILAWRHAIIDLDARVAYLGTLTRFDANDLSVETSSYVSQIQRAAATRSDRLHTVTRASQLVMLTLTGLSLLIAMLSGRYVSRLVGEIEIITASMSRLAGGDTAPGTPGMARRDELGELARSFEVFRDTLLAKQRLVRDLDAQRDLLEAVHNTLADGLAVFDRNGRLILWNARMEDLMARQQVVLRQDASPEDILAALPQGTTWQRPLQRDAGAAARLSAREWFDADHLELTTPEGQVLDLRSCAMPGGGTVSLLTDLSAQRTIQRQLQHAQKLEMLGQFTGGVAHDFNNYLATILGNLALLEDSVGQDGPARVQWQRVRRAAASAAGLTRRLLAFARRQPLQAEDVSLSDMLGEMSDLVDYSAGDGVSVRIDPAAEPLRVRVDRGQLENAILNLVINSASAMPDGGLLRIATRHIAATGPDGVAWAEISVADTGIGMSAVDVGKAFEPFFSTKPVGEGTGLGLSIVYGFVRQSGGEIALNSVPGAGTQVLLRFPAITGAAAAEASPGAMPPALEPPVALPGHALLVVEDDDAFRATLGDQLQRLQIRVHAAATADDALRLLESGLAVAGVLSDIRLGVGINGIELARILDRRWPALPVLLMSGEGTDLDTEIGRGGGAPTMRSAGAEDVPRFLQKPFHVGLVVAWLRARAVVA